MNIQTLFKSKSKGTHQSCHVRTLKKFAPFHMYMCMKQPLFMSEGDLEYISQGSKGKPIISW